MLEIRWGEDDYIRNKYEFNSNKARFGARKPRQYEMTRCPVSKPRSSTCNAREVLTVDGLTTYRPVHVSCKSSDYT